MKDKVAGCHVVPMGKPLRSDVEKAERANEPKTQRRRKGRSSKARDSTKETVNYWHHPTSDDHLPETGWRQTRDYWKKVDESIVERLRLRQFSGVEPTVDTITPW
jgi:hypothetical protein